MMRDSFIFYRSFFESAQMMNKTERLRFYDMLADYALNGVEPGEVKGASGVAFLSSRPSVDANNRKYENGIKGGRPKKNQTETKAKPNHNQTITKAKPYEDVYVDEDVDVDEEGEGHETPAPCTLEDVRAYARQSRSRSDPDRFFAYYSARGWKLEGRPIADWKALFDIWSSRGDRATFVDFPQRTGPIDLNDIMNRPGNLI